MDIDAAFAFVADAAERAAASVWILAALGAVVAVFGASFVLGESGAKLRAGIARLSAFALIGGFATVMIVSVKGVPNTAKVAEVKPRPADQRLDEWLDRLHRRAAAAPERASPAPSDKPKAEARKAEPRKVQPKQLADQASRLRDLAAARREHARVRAEIAAIPQTQRSPEHQRRDASALRGLAQIDRDEGRIKGAIERYRSAQALFAKLADPASKRAAVTTSLDMAEALDAYNEEAAARAAYRSAIAGQRGLVDLPEPERREGVAVALVRYATFETGRRQEVPARVALDEADEHYAVLRAERGKLTVLRARAELAMALGDFTAARAAVEAMRAIVAPPALADARPMVDMAEARIELAEGRANEAEVLFTRAVAEIRKAPAGVEQQRALVAALLGRAEAAFASRNVEVARDSAAGAIAISRALGDRTRMIHGLAQLALWEAAAGDLDTAEMALTLALGALREMGEARAAADTEATFQILCAGVLRDTPPCKTKLARDASASGP